MQRVYVPAQRYCCQHGAEVSPRPCSAHQPAAAMAYRQAGRRTTVSALLWLFGLACALLLLVSFVIRPLLDGEPTPYRTITVDGVTCVQQTSSTPYVCPSGE